MKVYGIVLLFLFFMHNSTMMSESSEESSEATSCEKQKKKVKENLKTCLKLCEDFFIQALHKELCHIARHLPQWIDKLIKISCRSGSSSFDDETFFVLVQLLEKKRTNLFLPFTTPLFNDLNSFADEKKQRDYVAFIMSSEKNALNFLEEMLQILEYVLKKENSKAALLQPSETTLSFRKLYK